MWSPLLNPDPSDLFIVTGTSRGIGQAVARLLVAEGRTVLGVARTGPDPGADGTAQMADGIRLLRADLSQPVEVERVVAAIAAICQREGHMVGGLLNNAGALGHLEPLGARAVADLECLMALHVYAPMRLVTGLLEHYRRGTRVLNLSSRAGHIPLAGMGPYCISKHAEVALTGTLRLELAARGILVGAVIPGEVDTHMQAELRTPDPSTFALGAFFRSNIVNLIPIEIAARFVHWVLTGTSDNDFAREDDWFIYDQPTEPQWLAPGQSFTYQNPDS